MFPTIPHNSNLDQVSFLHNQIFNSSKEEEEEEEEGENPHHHPPLSLYYYPSPFEDDNVLLFQHQQHHSHDLSLDEVPPFVMKGASETTPSSANIITDHPTTATTTTTCTLNNIKMVDWDANKMTDQPQIIPRRSSRSCKRDRHSKINTAQGPRDRRMRLSLQVARKFFGLQDVLGFDKASKTVEWLLIQSESEIDKLLKDHQKLIYNHHHMTMSWTKTTSPEISSESCEVVDEAAATNISIRTSNNGANTIIAGGVVGGKVRRGGNKTSGRRQLSSKSAFQPLTKASREKARARARERTREKNKNKHGLSRLSTSWSAFGTTGGEESAGNMNITSSHGTNSLEALAGCEVEDEPISSSQGGGNGELVNIGDATTTTTATTHDSLVIMGKWSPSSIFNAMHQINSTSTTGIPQEQQQQQQQHHHQFAADFQFFGKPWEVYNNGTPHYLF